MKPITLAVAEAEQEKRLLLEQNLQYCEDKNTFKILTDQISSIKEKAIERRLKPRVGLNEVDNIVARINRLKPRIILANIDGVQLMEEDRKLLLTLHKQCPNTMVVLLVNENAIEEKYLLDALGIGVRGFLDSQKLNTKSFVKMVEVVDKGEAWVSRKLLGKVMKKIVFPFTLHQQEVGFDSVS